MTRLNWCVLATHVPAGGALGGVVRYTTELVAALGRRGDVDVVAVARAEAVSALEPLVGETGRVRVVPPLPTAAMSLYERALPPLGGPYDVVQGVKHLLPRRARGLRVLTVHDMVLLDRPQDFGPVKRRLLPRPYLTSIREADLLVCVSHATERRLLAHVPEPSARTCVVPLATSPTLLEAPSAPLAQLQGRRFALVVGDLSPRKNLATVIDAWQAVRRVVPDAVLAIAGPPSWGRTDVGLRYQQLVDQEAVTPLGRVTDAQLRWCYESAQVVLCPSLVEGFGLPVAEALDLGAPVVVSDDPALVEAAAGRALQIVPALDHDSWVSSITKALTVDRALLAVPPQARTWDDVADETVEHVRRARHRA